MSLIRTLLAASSISDARGEIDQIAALVKRNPNYDLRLDFEITEAQVWAAEGRKADVITRLNSSVAEATKQGFVIRQPEAGLALGEIQLHEGEMVAGREGVLKLETAARSMGLLQFAREAATERSGQD